MQLESVRVIMGNSVMCDQPDLQRSLANGWAAFSAALVQARTQAAQELAYNTEGAGLVPAGVHLGVVPSDKQPSKPGSDTPAAAAAAPAADVC